MQGCCLSGAHEEQEWAGAGTGESTQAAGAGEPWAEGVGLRSEAGAVGTGARGQLVPHTVTKTPCLLLHPSGGHRSLPG